MGLFDQFPYTNFHELNLMWILEALKEIQTTTEQFVAINSLKYANPIQWNIVKQYEKNTIVIDPLTGTAYISVQPVPTGVALTNEDYWTVVFDLGSFVTRAAKNFTSRWEEDTTLTATFNTAAGQWLVWGDTLYRANVNITAGDSYVVDSNITRITVEEIKDDIYSYFDGKIGDLADLSTTDKDNLVAAINEIVSTVTQAVSDLQDAITNEANTRAQAITDEATTRAQADTALQTAINNEATTRADADTALQTAINNEATARADADTALQNEVDELSAQISASRIKKYIFINDSFGENVTPNISTLVPEYMQLPSDRYFSIVRGGAGFGSGTPYQYLTTLQANAEAVLSHFGSADVVTDVIVTGGTNDAYYGDTDTVIKDGIIAFANYVKTTYPNAKISIIFTGWTDTSGAVTNLTFANLRRAIIDYQVITTVGGAFYDLHNILHQHTAFNNDHIHPTVGTQRMFAEAISSLLDGGQYDIIRTLDVNLTPASGVTVNQGPVAFEFTQKNDIVTARLNRGGGNFWTATLTMQASTSGGELNNVLLGTIPDWIIGGNNTGSAKLNTFAIVGHGGSAQCMPIKITFQSNQVYLSIGNHDTSSSQYSLNAFNTELAVFDSYDC